MTETKDKLPCPVCGKTCTLTASGGMRHHLTDNPDHQSGPDSRKCKGIGMPPAGETGRPTGTGADGHQCRVCRHPVVLTANGRARSHLTPEAVPRPCPGGSDFPLGEYPDQIGTTDGRVATIAFDCEHREIGACHDCHAFRGADKPVIPAPKTEPCSHPEYDTDQYGATACIVCGEVKSEADQLRELIDAKPAASEHHEYTDPSGTKWVHEGPEETCDSPDCSVMRQAANGRDSDCVKCDTDDHRCPGCGTDVPHGVTACEECDRRTTANKIPPGMTEGGRLCHHDDATFGVEDGRAVCVACGTPCTHPVGVAYAGTDEDGRDVNECVLCGTRDPIVPAVPVPSPLAGLLAAESEGTGTVLDAMAARGIGPTLLGHLETGDHFVRGGATMRVTGETNGVIHAVVVGGPYDGVTGDLANLGEIVERVPAPQTKEQETQCSTVTTPQQRLTSSPAAPATTAPAPGSRPATTANAPAVSPESSSVTSSAPTGRAATNGRSAAVTDQSAAAAAFLGGGRPSVPTQPQQNPADAAAAFLAAGSGAHGEKEAKRDKWGRYLLPHPDTGKEKGWTRATTFAKSISDTYALSQWQKRMTLLGATLRPDVVSRAHGKHVRADKKLLDELTETLTSAAGDKVAAKLGTAMHSFTELVDRAWHTPAGPRSVLGRVQPDMRADVETYIALLEATGLEPVPNLIEFTTLVKQYGVAGTSDNCYKVTKPLTVNTGRGPVTLNPGEYVIGDKKTGRDLSYGWGEIAIQLAVYAQGLITVGRYDWDAEAWDPKPVGDAVIRADVGVIVHLPVEKTDGIEPAVWGLDLESGWNAAVLCERVRAWRNNRKLAAPVAVSEQQTFAPQRAAADVVRSAPMVGDYDPDTGVTSRTTVRPASLRDRAAVVTTQGEAAAVWDEATKAGASPAELDELVRLMQSRLRQLAEPGG
jgi:hypothetical protein